MFARSLFLVAVLVAESLAHGGLQLGQSQVVKRQGGSAFVPGTTPGCPADWPYCGSSGICYSPARGDVCCPGGTYACPGGSFCLIDSYCCPNGLDPASCAQQHGVTLPPSYASSAAPAPSTPAVSPSGAAPGASSSASLSVYGTAPTSTQTAKPTTPLFTGAASQNIVGGAAVVLGAVGLLGNFL